MESVSTSLPKQLQLYRQYTYLEYTIYPQIFHEYVGLLMKYNQYQQLNQLFCSLANTLLELFPDIERRAKGIENVIELERTVRELVTESELATALLEMLQWMLQKMPIDVVYHDGTVPNFLYRLLLHLLSSKQTSQPHLLYLHSLLPYIQLLNINKILKKPQQKLYDIERKQERIKSASQYYRQHLAQLEKSVYGVYCCGFERLCRKLSFVFVEREGGKNKMVPEKESAPLTVLELDQLPPYYLKYQNKEQKFGYIQQYMIGVMCEAFPLDKLARVEIMCLFYLEQYKETSDEKYDIFIYLLTVKIITQKNINIEAQLKDILHLRAPTITCVNVLVSALFRCVQQAQFPKLYDILAFLLKFYRDLHALDNAQYLYLTLMTSLVETVRKSGSIKAIIERVIEVPFIIQYINSVFLVDYMLGMLMGHVGGKNDVVGGALWGERQCGWVNSQTLKFLGDRVYIQPDPRHHAIISSLIQKRRMVFPNSPSLYLTEPILHNQLLSILHNILQQNTQKLFHPCILLLYMYGQSPRTKLSALQPLMFIVLSVLCERLQKQGQYDELVVCYELCFKMQKDKSINYQLLWLWMREKKVVMREELLMCVSSYDVIEIVCECSSASWGLAEKWVEKEENYYYTTQNRKLWAHQTKVQEFANILYRTYVQKV